MPVKSVSKPSSGPKKANTKPKKSVEVVEEKEIIYPDLCVLLYQSKIKIPRDLLKITADRAKTLLGWETEDEYFERFRKQYPDAVREACLFKDYLLKDREGKKVRCWRNSKNRPFSESWADALCQDILNKQWRFNGETIIISKTGVDLSGQHRLVALVLAAMDWHGPNSLHHQKKWSEEPYIEALVVAGVEEDQELVNTLDNVRSRTISDVFYTSPIFSDMAKDQRKKASNMLQNAVNFMWKRTVVSHSGTDIYQTHSTSVEFLDRHKKLTEFVRYFLDLDDKNALSKVGLGSMGLCSTLCYYQASSLSDPDEYLAEEVPSEATLNWDNENKAKRFWKEIADNTALFKPLRDGLACLTDPDTDKDPNINEKLCLLAKAWQLFANDEVISKSEILPKYSPPNDDGVKRLLDWPRFGIMDKEGAYLGIDFGQPGKSAALSEEEGGNSDEDGDEELTDEEMEERMSKERPKAQERAVKEKSKGSRSGK